MIDRSFGYSNFFARSKHFLSKVRKCLFFVLPSTRPHYLNLGSILPR